MKEFRATTLQELSVLKFKMQKQYVEEHTKLSELQSPGVLFYNELFSLSGDCKLDLKRIYCDTYRNFKYTKIKKMLKPFKNTKAFLIVVAGHPKTLNLSWHVTYTNMGGKSYIIGARDFRTFCNFYGINFCSIPAENWGEPVSCAYAGDFKKVNLTKYPVEEWGGLGYAM